jgi:hypothetical protein
MKQMTIYSPRTLLVRLAAAVVAAGLMTLVGAKPTWAADRSFVPAPNSPLSVNTTPTSVTSADFNADGKMDLAAQNANFITVSVLLGNGDGTFQSNHEFTVGFTPSSVISADFNGDTFADLAVANYSSNTVSILLGQDADGDNEADGTFKPKQDYSIQEPCTGDQCAPTAMQAPNQVIAKDFNADGKADLATANIGSCGSISQPGGISVLLGNGNGTFQDAKAYSMGNPICNSNGNILQNVVPSITAADVNSDGKADLAATIEKSNVVSVLLGNGDGTFSTGQDFAVGTRPSAVTGADLNNDTKADLTVSNVASDNVSVLFNSGSGGFQAAQNFPAGDGPAFVVGADFNADSFADLAVANQNSNDVSVLLNTAAPPPQTTITDGPSEGQEVNITSATFGFTSF